MRGTAKMFGIAQMQFVVGMMPWVQMRELLAHRGIISRKFFVGRVYVAEFLESVVCGGKTDIYLLLLSPEVEASGEKR